MKKRMIKYIALALLAGVAHAEETTYDPATRTLSIPSMVIGDTRYNDLKVRVDNAVFLSSSSASKVSGSAAVAPVCATEKLTLASLDKIKVGMTLEQVNQTLGCQYNVRQLFQMQPTTRPSPQYIWYSMWKSITVTFSPAADAVAPPELGTEFKRGDFLN